MAHYSVVDDFRTGMPQTALVGGLRPRGISCHTTEGAEGEAGALGTIQFLIDRADRNASYSEIWYAHFDGFRARRIVHHDRAAHSMNPTQPPWAPDARVRRILGDRWGDPNAVSYAISIAGTTAITVPKLVANSGFMDGARRRTGELLAQFAASLSPDPLYNHGEGQADRSDWGPLMRPALLQEDALPALKPVRQQWTTGIGDTLAASTTATPGGQFWTLGPDAGERKFFTAAERVWSNAETADTFFREVEYGSEVIWMHRNNLRPIAGTRNPATGFGAPTLTTTGFTQAQLDAAKAASFAAAKTKAKGASATAIEAIRP